MVNPTPLPWSIKPRDGKYYGTEIVGPQNEDVCELWIRERRSAEDNGPSARELERLGPFSSDEERDEVWREYNCDSHYESARDFANATFIVKAMNNHEALVRALRTATNWMLCDNEFGDPEQFKTDLAEIKALLGAVGGPST